MINRGAVVCLNRAKNVVVPTVRRCLLNIVEDPYPRSRSIIG